MPNVPIQVRLSVDEVSALDSWRRTKSNPPSRARALHELACGAFRGRGLQNSNASDLSALASLSGASDIDPDLDVLGDAV
jgi:hypothetical protein